MEPIGRCELRANGLTALSRSVKSLNRFSRPYLGFLFALVRVGPADLAAQADEWSPSPGLQKIVAPVCQNWALSRLRAPTHARLLSDPRVSGRRSFALTVSLEFEAMNSFGGFDRVTFTCLLEFESTGTYRMERVEILGPTADIVDFSILTAPRSQVIPAGLLPQAPTTAPAAQPPKRRQRGRISWVADRRNGRYYVADPSCWTGQQIPDTDRVRFDTEEAAKAGAMGRRRAEDAVS